MRWHSHLTCKVANKCLNVRERLEVVEWNKMVPSLPLLSCELSVSVKENPDRKKKKKKFGIQASSLNTWISEAKFLFFGFFSNKNQIMSITKMIPLDASLYMSLLHYEHKFSICVIRRRYPERKNFPNSSFFTSFYHLNLNIRETFLFCFQT